MKKPLENSFEPSLIELLNFQDTCTPYSHELLTVNTNSHYETER